MNKDPEDFLFDGAATFQKKTKDYGQSWKTIGYILWQMANEEPITLESPEDIISFGLFTRRMDKMARAFHGEFQAEEMNFESVVDAHEDEMVYAAMAATNQHDKNRIPDEEEVVFENQFGKGHPGRPSEETAPPYDE